MDLERLKKDITKLNLSSNDGITPFRDCIVILGCAISCYSGDCSVGCSSGCSRSWFQESCGESEERGLSAAGWCVQDPCLPWHQAPCEGVDDWARCVPPLEGRVLEDEEWPGHFPLNLLASSISTVTPIVARRIVHAKSSGRSSCL